jgi:hypothetical protein
MNKANDKNDIMSSYGIFKDTAKVPPASIREETEAAEMAIALEVWEKLQREK